MGLKDNPIVDRATLILRHLYFRMGATLVSSLEDMKATGVIEDFYVKSLQEVVIYVPDSDKSRLAVVCYLFNGSVTVTDLQLCRI